MPPSLPSKNGATLLASEQVLDRREIFLKGANMKAIIVTVLAILMLTACVVENREYHVKVYSNGVIMGEYTFERVQIHNEGLTGWSKGKKVIVGGNDYVLELK